MCLACSQSDRWTVNCSVAREVAEQLELKADETTDAHDHDELHAAAAVVRILANKGIIPPHYIERWIEGLRDVARDK